MTMEFHLRVSVNQFSFPEKGGENLASGRRIMHELPQGTTKAPLHQGNDNQAGSFS